MSVSRTLKSSDHSEEASATLSRLTLTRNRSPTRCTAPSSTASTLSSRPACTASISCVAYFRTALVGRTVRPDTLLTFMMMAFAMPSPK